MLFATPTSDSEPTDVNRTPNIDNWSAFLLSGASEWFSTQMSPTRYFPTKVSRGLFCIPELAGHLRTKYLNGYPATCLSNDVLFSLRTG